ncbi:MAG TPA: YopJ family acetyltransferase [Paraburkholderia sp.]
MIFSTSTAVHFASRATTALQNLPAMSDIRCNGAATKHSGGSMPNRIPSNAISHLPSPTAAAQTEPRQAQPGQKQLRKAGSVFSGLKRRISACVRPVVTPANDGNASAQSQAPAPRPRLAAVPGVGVTRLQESLGLDARIELRFRRESDAGGAASAGIEALHVPLRDVGFGAGLIAHAPQQNADSTTASARRSAIAQLDQVKAHFQALLLGNWSPGPTDDKYDAAILPAIVAAENARSPALSLTLLSPKEDFASWLKATRPARARVMFPMPGNDGHYVTADIRRIGGKTSVIVIEPLSLKDNADLKDSTRDKYEKRTLPLLKKALKSDVTLSVLTVDTQKSTNDCRVFALSAAAKLTDHASLINSLHQQNLSRQPIRTALGQDAEVLASTRKVRVLDGKGILPPAFVKHSQSRTTLNNWLKANPPAFANAGINKKDQSLAGRFDDHRKTRYDKPVHSRFMQDNLPDLEVQVRNLTFSTSIEQKRLTYLDRAIEYLRHAPEGECSRLLASMGDVSNDPPGPANLRLDDRDWGPHPDSL